MPGLTGIFKTDAEAEVSSIQLTEISGKLKHFESYVCKVIKYRNLGILAVNRDSSQEPYNTELLENGEAVVGMQGEFYNLNLESPDGASGKLNFILNNYKNKGNLDFLKELNGKFNIALFDKIKNKLYLVNDRYALLPLYYFHKEGLLLFSPEIKALLTDENVKFNINERSVIDFFTFEYVIGDKTFLKDIRILPPASIAEFDGAGLKIKRYWDFNFTEDIKLGGFNDYVAEHHKIMNSSVNDRIKDGDRLGIFLSAGLDSRLIAAHTRETVRPFDTFSFNSSKKLLDAKLSSEIARIVGSRHHFTPLTSDLYRENCERYCYLTDGKSVRSSYYNYLCPELKKFNINNLMVGHYGDNIHGSHISDNGLKPDASDYMTKMCEYIVRTQALKGNVEEIRRIFKPELFSGYYDIVYSNVEETVRHIKDRKNWHISNHFEMVQRQRRLTGNDFNFHNFFFEIKFPYTDYRLADFCNGLPYDILFDQKLQRYSLMINFPELNEITWPWSRTRPVEKSAFKNKYFPMLNKLDTILKRSAEIISRGRCTFVPRATESPEDHWLRFFENREFINKYLLNKNSASREYIDLDAVKKTLDLHNCGRKNYGRIIFALLTFEIWLSQNA